MALPFERRRVCRTGHRLVASYVFHWESWDDSTALTFLGFSGAGATLPGVCPKGTYARSLVVALVHGGLGELSCIVQLGSYNHFPLSRDVAGCRFPTLWDRWCLEKGAECMDFWNRGCSGVPDQPIWVGGAIFSSSAGAINILK